MRFYFSVACGNHLEMALLLNVNSCWCLSNNYNFLQVSRKKLSGSWNNFLNDTHTSKNKTILPLAGGEMRSGVLHTNCGRCSYASWPVGGALMQHMTVSPQVHCEIVYCLFVWVPRRICQNFQPRPCISLLIREHTGFLVPFYLQSPAAGLHREHQGRSNYRSEQW